MTIIKFPTKEPEGMRLSGVARCVGCGHEWTAVCEHVKGDPPPFLDCPDCGRQFGLFKFPFHPGETEALWVCNCGNDLFHVTPDGVFCPSCGITSIDLWE
jgi:DNA-directed RNA polymerase subunit RPC12/RpoP